MKRIFIPIAAILLFAACSTTTEKEQPGEATVTTPEVAPAVVTVDTLSIDAVTSATAMPNHSSFNGKMIVPPQRRATVTLTMG